MIKLVYVIVSILIIGLIINQLIKCFSPKIIEGATGSKDESDACGKDPVLLQKPIKLNNSHERTSTKHKTIRR